MIKALIRKAIRDSTVSVCWRDWPYTRYTEKLKLKLWLDSGIFTFSRDRFALIMVLTIYGVRVPEGGDELNLSWKWEITLRSTEKQIPWMQSSPHSVEKSDYKFTCTTCSANYYIIIPEHPAFMKKGEGRKGVFCRRIRLSFISIYSRHYSDIQFPQENKLVWRLAGSISFLFWSLFLLGSFHNSVWFLPIIKIK